MMLEKEKQTADKLAYDKPSPKLLSFMAKHYCLKQYDDQNNNFVVYRQYF
jgi:alpha-tubulin N-acetyltransferase 1